ncbi:MAG: tetratricopeptide repeat protein, partial [Bacteroidetes bacterium]|nr:tetratricopeptide repeat protein [Bacteroidota bacterium]
MNIFKSNIYRLILIALLTILWSSNAVFCQNTREVDSLLTIIKNSKSDTIKIEAYSNLFFIYEFSDTVKAQYYLEQELNLSKKFENSQWLASTYTHFAFFYEDKGDLNTAIEFHEKALKLYKENTLIKIKDKITNVSACYNNTALIYSKLGVYDKAIDFYFLSLKMDELLKDSLGISISYSNIGIIHRKLGNDDKALEYYFKSLKIAERLNNENRMTICYNNIGLAYQYKKDYSKAIYYLSKSIIINEKNNDLRLMAGCYNNLGNVYFETGDYTKCLNYYNKSLDIRCQIGDKEGQASVLGNIAALYTKQKQYDKAILNANKSVLIAKEINVLPWQMTAYEVLAQTYDSIKNYKKAYEYHKLFKIMKDSIYSIEGNQQIKGMEAKYENEKKQKEIELLNKDKLLQKTEIKQQIIVKYAFIIGFTLMILLVIFVYRNYRNKKKANVLLEQQNIEISQQKEEITSQRDEIEAQRDKLGEQNHLLEGQKKNITDSITYAKQIQQAVLPSGNYANSILGEHFILFKPKDIVSGDFYWGTRVNEWLIVTVADCTGHGVPGAFMSMLGVSFLNEIVRKKEVTKASEVLDHLRNSIIDALKQKGVMGEQKDGMDIAICALNTETLMLQYAGANNPLYIVKNAICHLPLAFGLDTTETNGQQPIANSQLIELK